MTHQNWTSGLRWMRDKFAAWLATTWLYLILWTVVALTFGVLLYIDGKFSRGLAEGVEAIDPLSFQMMGWAYRLFAAAFLMAAARCAHKGIKGQWTFRFLGAFASVIVCLHALGFGLEALSDRRDGAMAVAEVAATQAEGNDALIAALREQKASIDADTAKAVATLDAEIYNLDNDGKLNEERTDRMRDRREALQDKALADKAALDAEILALMRAGSEGKAESITTVAEAKPWAPLFIGIAQLVTWSQEPENWWIYICAVGFIVMWVLLGESLVIFLPERIYLMHLKDAESRQHEELFSDEVPAGHVNVTVPNEEWDEMQEALKVHRNIKEGAVKGARTRRRGNKIEAERGYMESRVSDFMTALSQGLSPAQVAAKYGLTMASLQASYGGYFTAEEHEAFFGPRFQPEPEQEPPVAVSDSPQEPEADDADAAAPDEPEPEAEPEPAKDYGVALYDPANEEKPDEEAA